MWTGWQKAERNKRHLNIKKQEYTIRYTYLLLEKIRKLNVINEVVSSNINEDVTTN